MKGMIMEKNDNILIIMTQEGEFLEVKTPNEYVEVGQEIEVGSKYNLSRNSKLKRIVAMAAILVLCVLGGGYGVYGYYAPFGYVNVDINPSVEIAYNLYDKVIDIRAINEDGEKVISDINEYKFKSVDTIVNKIIDTAIEESYIKNDEKNTVLVTITKKGSDLDDNAIYEAVDNHIKETGTNTSIILMESKKETFEEARKENLSPGKTMLAERALSVSEGLSLEEVERKSVKEIMEIINENKKEEKQLEKDNRSQERELEKIAKEAEKQKLKGENKNKDIVKNSNIHDAAIDKGKSGSKVDEDSNNKFNKNDDNSKNKIEKEHKNDIEDKKDKEDKEDKNNKKGNSNNSDKKDEKKNDKSENEKDKSDETDKNESKNNNNNSGIGKKIVNQVKEIIKEGISKGKSK